MIVPKRLAVGLTMLVLFAALAAAGSAGGVPWIKGNLIVHPNATIDPGHTTLTFDADITGLTPGTKWVPGVEVKWAGVPGEDHQSQDVVVAAPGHFSNLLGAYTVPCTAGRANQVCFKLYAFTAVGIPEYDVTLGTVCLAVKPYVGPSQPQLIVQAPVPIRPGTVLRFAAKIPRKDCGDLYRVVRSPIDAPGAWSTGWREGCPSTPAVVFPKTFTVPAFTTTTAGFSQEGKDQLCFVLEDQYKQYSPVDKWCWQPVARVAAPPVTMGHVGLPTPTPGPSRGRHLSLKAEPQGARLGSLPAGGAHVSPIQPIHAAAVLPKPDLVVKFEVGGGGFGPPTGFEILNQGGGVAGPSQVRFSKPGIAPTLVRVQSLPSGGMFWISIPNDHEELMLYTGGGSVTADAMHQVDESNEANNTYVWTWTPPKH
jgi:hypothetical protein